MLVMSFVMIGSLICATAMNSTIFIIGRAIAGVGAGGVISGSMTITAYTVPLYRRPKFTGGLTSLFGVFRSHTPLLKTDRKFRGSSTRWGVYRQSHLAMVFLH